MSTRKPLTFNVEDAAPIPNAAQAANERTAVRLAAGKRAAAKPKALPPEPEERQQVGARIRKTTYRQLKARAALEGRKVQELVELAVEAYLAKH